MVRHHEENQVCREPAHILHQAPEGAVGGGPQARADVCGMALGNKMPKDVPQKSGGPPEAFGTLAFPRSTYHHRSVKDRAGTGQRIRLEGRKWSPWCRPRAQHDMDHGLHGRFIGAREKVQDLRHHRWLQQGSTLHLTGKARAVRFNRTYGQDVPQVRTLTGERMRDCDGKRPRKALGGLPLNTMKRGFLPSRPAWENK